MAMAVNRGVRAGPAPVAAPVGGLNARDALAAMPPSDASVLTNMFPYQDRVETRPGFTLLSTAASISMSTKPEGFRRFARHMSADGTETTFGAYYYLNNSGGSGFPSLRFYSIATNGTLTNSLDVIIGSLAGFLVAFGEATNFTAASGANYLIWPVCTSTGVNVQAFDGTTWTVPTINFPVSVSQLVGVHGHRNRLWFYGGTGTDGLNAFYLPTGAIAGTTTTFQVGPFCKKGGHIATMTTWSRDGGEAGGDDYAAFITSEGEIIVYQGTDPSNAATWQMVGQFDVGRLIGWNASSTFGQGDPSGLQLNDGFAMKYGSDVLLNTQAGITSLSRVVGREMIDYSISAKVRPLLIDEGKKWTLSGVKAIFKMLYAPTLKHLIVNAPQSFSTDSSGGTAITSWVSTWYVMNSETGAWCTYTGLNMLDAIVANDAIYWTDGSRKIYKMDGSALSDNSTAITFECRQAYNYLGNPTNKLATVMQLMLRATGNFSLTAQCDADFNAGTISSYKSYTVSPAQNLSPILSPAKYGRAFATHIAGQTTAGIVSWYATNYIAQAGRMI